MVLRLAILAWLGCLAAAGPVAWDDSKCAQKCNGGVKYQYSEQTSYIYSYESLNEMQADGASDLSMKMKATIKLTTVSKCEMVLQVIDATLHHGPLHETSSPFIDELKKNPLPFSWNDGKIEHVCPSPEDSNEVNNVKKAILSAFQNTMPSFEANLYEKEVDVLGTCDTEYTVKENKNDKFVFKKDKDIATCTDHLKGHTLLLASFYESSSQRQHIPFLSGEKLSCEQTIENGIVQKVHCEEKASFKPLYELGYVVEATGHVTLQKLSSEPASRILYRAPQKESLVFKYNPTSYKGDHLEAEAQNVLRHICENSEGLITKNVGNSVHKLVYIIRGMNEGSLERIYESLKNGQLCSSRKALTIFMDALKAASSGGSIALFSKLVASGEVRGTDALLWMSLLPFASHLDEESVAATLTLLKKDSAHRQALLGVSAMTYKYCSTRSNCEDSNAVKAVSSSLKQFLGDKCQTTNVEEEMKIITALKAFGNLGYVGESADSIFECAGLESNKMIIRISAIEAFRRSPCSEQIVSKLLDIYKNKNEDDEVRIASLISLSKCATNEILRHVVEAYKVETSKQVEVFTWSYLENLQSSSDPSKNRLQMWLEDVKAPHSTDITKFSRNFQLSLFSEFLNIGRDIEANVIHSKNSFLPRSASLGYKTNIFGNQLDLFQIGGRVEDLEHILEKLFGPRGLMPNLDINDVLELVPIKFGKRKRRSAESYKSKIEALSERLGYSRGRTPHGSAYFRVLGHELVWLNLQKDVVYQRLQEFDLDSILKDIVSSKGVDVAKNLLYLDVSVLFPSVTGRAYKLAGNGSLTLGLKTDRKIDIQKSSFPIPRISGEGLLQPSVLGDVSASFSIHSENFEPGVKVETTLNAGLDLNAKLEFKDGRLLHVKIGRRQERQEILNLKRTLYSMNHRGVTELPKPESYNLNYCTKYVQEILGVRYCASATIPHIYNAQGKPKIPFVRAMEASLVVEKTDKNMEGYELLLQLPEWGAREERNYKFLFDTPNSAVDRKLSIDLTAKRPNSETTTVALKTYSPFYVLDVDVDVTNRADAFRLKADALGNRKRRYSLLMDVGKDVKGARLVEYQPKISLIVPNVRPIELSGTIVFARGRKEQITIDMQSSSFDSPFTIKGNLAKGGGNINLDEDWKVNSEINISVFSQIHRFQGSLGNEEGKGIFLDVGHHYEPDGRGYESVTVNAKVENIELRDRLQFGLETTVLFAEHQDLNSNLRWDFSLKPFAHLKNDIVFRYGENFDDEKHLVRVTQKASLYGDFETFQHMDIENKLGLTISCLDFDKYAAFSAIWDFIEKPRLFVEIGVKTKKDKEISFTYDYKHLTNKPLKLAAEGKFVYYNYKFLYKDQVHEVAPNEYKGKAVMGPGEGEEITVDYVYKIKSQTNFHHEFDGTITFPGNVVPVQLKTDLEVLSDSLKFNGNAVSGSRKYSIDMNLQKSGASDISLNTPFVEGTVNVVSQNGDHSVRADIKMVGKSVDRRIVVTGNIAQNDIITLTLDVLWDADKEPDRKLSIKAQSRKETEGGIEKHMITATISYQGSINVDVNGKISTDLIRGPHYFRADFSGDMEPMAIEYTHEIKNGEVESVAKYLRSNVEKLRLDMKGKFVLTGSKFQSEYGLFLSSPYKTFDGKEMYFQIMADSNEVTRVFIAEYRLKPAAVIGYIGKIDYQRKRGWPGQIRSNLLVTVHGRPMYEGSSHVDYGNGKYSWKTSFTPISKRRINLLTSFEHSGKFAAFHHSLSTSLQYLQKVELNAVADLRNMEDAKVHSNLNVNQHQMYDVNSTLKMRSMIDYDLQLVILSKITPSLHVFHKTQSSGQLLKYEMNLDVDSINLIAGKGEVKKRKKGFNGDMAFTYKGKEFLVLTISQEAKTKAERYYVIKTKTPWRSHSASIRINKEKKGSVKYETKFCRLEEDKCIAIDAFHKEPTGDVDEWQISYRRGAVDFSIERIRVSTKDLSRFHTVIYNGDKRFGYDLRVAKEGNGNSVSLGIILPSREIVTKTYAEVSLQRPRIKFEFSADARKYPERKLITDIRFENHLTDNNPSKLQVTISHPIYEKPIELQLIGDYEPNSNKFFTAEVSADYTNDPEDKIIGKLSLEKTKGETAGTAILNIYHKDDQNLDFVVKLNGTMNEDEDFVGIFWNWKGEDDVDQQAFSVFREISKERKFYFEYNRPKLVYRLDGAIITPQTLLGETTEVDLTSVYNGEATKAKFLADFSRRCYKLVIFNDEGETARIIELCATDSSRKILSIMSESLDDEGQWTFDFAVDVVRKSWRTINIRSHYSPEFLGAFLFKATSLGDELSAAGFGKLPIYDSPKFKLIRNAFHSKIFQPSVRFFIPEAARFIADIKRDSTFAAAKLRDYYDSLPPLTEVKESIQKIRHFIRAALFEIWDAVESYYKEYFRNAINFVNKATGIVKAVCLNNEECNAFVNAFNQKGWRGVVEQIRIFIQSLPQKVRNFMDRPGVDARKFFDKAMVLVKAVLQPLTKYECGEIVVKVVQLSYQALEPYIQKFLENYPHYYRTVRQAIVTNKYVIQSAKIAEQGYHQMRAAVLKIDYEKLYKIAKKYVEDCLFNFTPPSPKSSFSVKSFDVENGHIDFDIHFGISQSYPIRVITRIMDRLTDLLERYASNSAQFSSNALLVKFKRAADLNFFPPYEAQAMLVGNHHFVTFDKVFYDFAGECTYLLSRDFEDGNFTFALKPSEGGKDPSILALINDISVELNNGEKTVSVEDNLVELPYLTKDFAISRSGSTVILDDKRGVKVKCNLVHQICTFSISGWYYGKTAGLLGTYNYETSDEFKRPKGQIANSASVLAKSWELKKGCKSNNLVPDVRINENSNYYKLCKNHFQDTSSPLAACFNEVEPKEYFQLCTRHLATASDASKALCNIAAAYVMECERNYIELNLPSKCITCTAPDGSTLQHGDRKKYENLSKTSADVVFIVEDQDCNKAVVNDLGNLARSIDRELQNDGFKDIMFAVVGYGGDVGNPQIYTVKGNTFFNSRDINAIKDRIKVESKKVESSRAFEAMKLAVTYLFRSDTAKSFVLLSCSPCKYDYKSLQYPVIHQILLERGITLHIIHNAEISTRKSSIKEKDLIGVDPGTVYHAKDVTQKDLVGEPALRSHVSLPKDLCIALSQDVNGSFFSSHSLIKASSAEIKNWRSVFARKFLKSVQSFQCQLCDCTSTRDHIPNTICQPCETKRPRLPFSVCKSCALPRTVETFLSFILQYLRK